MLKGLVRSHVYNFLLGNIMDNEKITSGESTKRLDDIVDNYETKMGELQSKSDEFSSLPNVYLQHIKELIRIGRALKLQVQQTKDSYNKLQQLIDATQIPLLFLNRDLKILRYTPAVSHIFPHTTFIEGQPLADVLRHSIFKKVKKQIQKCFKNPQPQEVEFYLNKSKEWFLTRILPYPATEQAATGIIITFLNITQDKVYEAKLNKLNQSLELEVQKQNQQVKKLASELIVAEQKERKRIARLLHNDLQQQLFSIKTKGELLEEDVPAEFTDRVNEIVEQVNQSLKLTHQLVVSLSPPNVENNDLYKGIHWLCTYIYNFHSLLVDTSEVRHIELENNDVLVLLLQMIQELLFNVVKHADIDKAKVTTREENGVINIHVIDKGKGFTSDEVDSMASFGLSQIKDQLELIGGNFSIESTPGEGTDVSLSIPKRNYVNTIG